MTRQPTFITRFNAGSKVSLLSIMSAIICSCTATNPDFSEEAQINEGQIETAAGEVSVGGMTAGESTAGESTAGESTAGESTAGESTAGESTAGESTAGESTAGESTAGESTAGESTAGESTAGESTAGESTAGESTAGESTAGESTAGESTAGESTAGESTAGESTAGESTIIDVDGDSFSPPLDCNDQDEAINPNADERCDNLDNDCDRRVDEGTLNACNACGPTPIEECDNFDNDCDGRTDEGTLNACNTCGPTPIEECDNFDNDCDGRTDEGTLNACEECGPVPLEVCDGLDNDCDGQIDEDFTLNACGTCGSLSDEICDGIDNDCDDQVDEDLLTPCFVLKHTIIPPVNNIIRMGTIITIVGDLNGDGIDDAIVRSEQGTGIRLLAFSGTSELLWSMNGGDDYASAISAGRFFGGDDVYIATNDPINNRLFIIRNQGSGYMLIDEPEGDITSLTTLRGDRDTLVVGIADADDGRGLIKKLRFGNNNRLEPTVEYSSYGQLNQNWGERTFNAGDLIGNNSDDLIFTQTFNRAGREDIGTVIMDGGTGVALNGSLLTVPQNTYFSFAYDLATGVFSPGSNDSFAYGAPLVSNMLNNRGAVYTLNSQGGQYFQGETIFGNAVEDGLGISLATLPRLNAAADTLVIGGFDKLIYRDFSRTPGRQDVPLPTEDLYVGFGLAIAQTPSADGTYQMWVSGLSDLPNESRVWILTAR